MGGGNKLRGRDQFKRYKRILFFMAKVVSFLPKKKREVIYILCRNIHGNIGIALRYIILKTLAKSCGDNVAVMEGVYLKNISQIEFANNISIHPITLPVLILLPANITTRVPIQTSSSITIGL